MSTFDSIDIIAASVYDIDPVMLYSKTRPERLAYARFVAISLRNADGVNIGDIAIKYNLHIETIRHSIRKSRELVKYNTAFRNKYNQAVELYKTRSVPFAPELITAGCRVRTRTDSNGVSFCGIVTAIGNGSFTVESFDNAEYKTTHDLRTGRISVDYESSRDIVVVTV